MYIYGNILKKKIIFIIKYNKVIYIILNKLIINNINLKLYLFRKNISK